MKRSKSNLDEMQELKLLRIEHTGFWLFLWGLAIAIYAQMAMGHSDFASIGGEAIVLTVVAMYISIRSIRNGIWDRKLKPDFKTNLLISLASGLALGGFWFFVSYRNYHNLAGSFATFAVMAISVFVLVLAVLLACSAAYKKKRQKLDTDADMDEDEA